MIILADFFFHPAQKSKSFANRYFFFTAIHTCRCGTDASSSGLTGRVATAIVRTEQNNLLKERMSNVGLADMDQSLKDLEIECTLKTAPKLLINLNRGSLDYFSIPSTHTTPYHATNLNRAECSSWPAYGRAG